MTKEEIKEVMKEMECWYCDNHLNICDKHIFTNVEHEAKECSCNISKGRRGWTDYEIHERGCELDTSKECKHYQFSNQPRNCDICKPEINTYTPKECKRAIDKVEAEGRKIKQKWLESCKCEHHPCVHTINTTTPPSKQPRNPRESICKKCGKSWPPRQGTYIVPLEYKEELCGECNDQPTRLELIREKIRLSGVARMNGRDVKYILSKLATAVEILEEIAHSLDGNYEEGWMANEVAAEAIRLINEDE